MNRTEYSHMEQATLLEDGAPSGSPPTSRGRKIAAFTAGVALVACVVVAAVRFAGAPAPSTPELRELQQQLHVEVYFGPMCPNSLNFLSMSLDPFMSSGIPQNLVLLTLFPYITAADMQPAYCAQQGTACFLAKGPACLLSPYQQVPYLTLQSHVRFVSCGLSKVAMNHAANAALYGPAAENACAAESGVPAPNCGPLVPGGPSAAMISAAAARISAFPGTQPPYVFINQRMLQVNAADGQILGYKEPNGGVTPINGLAGAQSLGGVICSFLGAAQPGCAGM